MHPIAPTTISIHPPPQLHYYENIMKKILQITSFQANTGISFTGQQLTPQDEPM